MDIFQLLVKSESAPGASAEWCSTIAAGLHCRSIPLWQCSLQTGSKYENTVRFFDRPYCRRLDSGGTSISHFLCFIERL